VVVLEDAGSVLASALTCAGLALADASIHMFDILVGASSVSFEFLAFYRTQFKQVGIISNLTHNMNF